MPIRNTKDGWYWGSKGPFPTKQKALQVAAAAQASGFKETKMDYTPQHFVLTMLHSVTNAHILHFQSRSYSEHKVLGKYYKEMGDLVDAYVEAYQGKFGIISNYEPVFTLPAPALEYLITLNDYVLAERADLPQDSELQNLVDEIALLIDSTIYKLRFLR
jgi:hypothetical protein